MSDKQKAIETISALVSEHGLTYNDLKAIINRTSSGENSNAAKLTRLFTYMGGVLIFAGLGFLISLIWDDLNSYARVIITLGPGMIALAMGIASLSDERFIKASTPLFLIAAGLQTTGLFVFLKEFFDGGDPNVGATIVFGIMAVQNVAVFAKLRRPSLVFYAVLFCIAFFSALLDVIGIDEDINVTIVGLSGLLISYGLDQNKAGTIYAFTPFTYFISAMMFAFGCYDLLKNIPLIDFGLLGIAALLIFASVQAHSRSLLTASVIIMLGYLGYITDEYFANITGWPVALIILGMIMIFLSSYAVKLGQTMKSE